MMKKYTMGFLATALILGLNAAPVQAFQCPALAEQCRTLVGKMESRAGANNMKVSEAKQGCEDALALHKAGKHKASVIKAGEAISMAGQAAK
ncbi:MAG: hypothetical protein O7B27_00680 [Gammaproteobacteria bacterium]|jgi:hypothetical protein|nr:hypothetical protein [Gammaproteobacteria bacterium]